MRARRRRRRAPRARTGPAWFRRRAGSDPAAWRGRSSSAAHRARDRCVTSMAARAALAASVPGVSAVAPVIFREFRCAARASFARDVRDCLTCHRSLLVFAGKRKRREILPDGRKHRRCCRNTPSVQKFKVCPAGLLAHRSIAICPAFPGTYPQWPDTFQKAEVNSLAVYSCGGSCGFEDYLRSSHRIPFSSRFRANRCTTRCCVLRQGIVNSLCGGDREKVFQVDGIRRRKLHRARQ